MATGNMHRPFGEIRTCGLGDMRADRHTNTLIAIYFAPPYRE